MTEGPPSRRLGLSSYAFRWAFGFGDFRPRRPMAPQELIDVAAGAGLGVVQLCDNVPLLTCSTGERAALRDHAARRGVRLETGIRGTAPATLAAALAVTKELGADLLRVVVEIDRRDAAAIDGQVAAAAADLRSVLPMAQEAAVVIAVENHATIRAEEMVRLLAAVGDARCGACIDTMNSVLLIERPDVTVSGLAPYALSVHLKDFLLAKEADCYRVEGTALGDGGLDLPAIVGLVKDRRRVHSWHAELYIPRDGDERRTLARERRAVDRSIERLLALGPVLDRP